MNALRPIIAAALLITAVPASAAGSFMLVNGTGESLSSLSFRPVGSGSWQPLGSGSAGSGSRQPISVEGEQCAFEIRGALPGGRQVVWSGVNLCETKAVTLNRRSDGTIWVEYD